MVAKDPMFDRRRPELTIFLLVSAVRLFLLRNWQHPKILYRFSDSNCVIFLHGAGVDEGGIGRRLVASL